MSSDENKVDFSVFLASIAHDMKNSLSMFINSLDEVINSCTPDVCPSHNHLSQLQYESKRLNNNLIQLLTIYKMDRSQYNLNISFHPVADFLEENVLLNKPLLDFKGISIDVVCPEDLTWFFDRDLIAGIINNVMNNAYRYTKDRIRISACEEGSDLSITIEDNGQGYPDHMLKSVTQTHKGVSFNTGSTGLGLYFASLVANMHTNKGRTGSISTSNGGFYGGGCFKIILP